jgi:prepilin-type processing-associated H-X9-DG protein
MKTNCPAKCLNLETIPVVGRDSALRCPRAERSGGRKAGQDARPGCSFPSPDAALGDGGRRSAPSLQGTVSKFIPAASNSLAAPRPRTNRASCAFTLVELLVLLATLAILAVLVLPALANSKPGRDKAYQCLNNMRQLATAFTLYANDNHDQMVINMDLYRFPPGPGGTGANWCQGIENWTTSSGNTNIINLTLDNYALLAPYTVHRYQIYHCPEDHYVSPVQAALRWAYRPRSVSMSAALGSVPPNASNGGRAPEFPWAVRILKQKLSDIINTKPSNVWVFLDEAPDSINDSMFYNNPDATGALTGTANGGNWIDWPASWHDGGCTFSFVDGHVELHQWVDANTRRTTPPAYTSGVTGSKSATKDVAWMSAHTPVP